MKTKTIPFDLETAKKIQAGEIEGKIVTKNGNRVRIVCFDAKRVYAERDIIALVEDDDFTETLGRYRTNGELRGRTCEDDDLFIELPEEAPKHELVAKDDTRFFTVENGRISEMKTVLNQKPQFKPFDKVLVRENNNQAWRCDMFSHMSLYDKEKYRCIGAEWSQCIPYEGHEHLVGTTNKPKEE